MELEFDLIENALHSLNEALKYYNENADEDINVDKFKFCVIHTNHCIELLLKEILIRVHPAFIYEDIDKYTINNSDELQTIGYTLALKRVKKICNIDFQQYESYIADLGKIRNKIQHYKCKIDGIYYKNLIIKAFSAIEYILQDIMQLDIKNYEHVIDIDQLDFLLEDAATLEMRINDIRTEFRNNRSIRFEIEYDRNKYFQPPCPICGTYSLSVGDNIRCKMCNSTFENFEKLCEADDACIMTNFINRELGRRKPYIITYECSECDNNSVVFQYDLGGWICLCCGTKFGDSTFCDDCGNDMPCDDRIAYLAMSDTDTEDYFYLCPDCARKAKESEDYIGYDIE